jgi:glycerophosphoryl diester phosphodiesterase
LLYGPIDRTLSPAPDPERVGWLRGVTYAHRGLHGRGRPENSLAAFAAALDAGLGIECDVQRTADGRAVVFHDWELDRLTGDSGPVAARSVAELTRIALRSADQTIPTLRDLLELVAGRAPLLIELKSREDRPVSPLCRAVLRDLEGYTGPHAVMSFDPRAGHWFAARSAATVRGLVVSEANARTFGAVLKRHAALWRARPDFLAYDVRDLPSRFAAAQRARGLPLLTWTVGTAGLRERAGEHADGWIAEAEGVATGPVAPSLVTWPKPT